MIRLVLRKCCLRAVIGWHHAFDRKLLSGGLVLRKNYRSCKIHKITVNTLLFKSVQPSSTLQL